MMYAVVRGRVPVTSPRRIRPLVTVLWQAGHGDGDGRLHSSDYPDERGGAVLWRPEKGGETHSMLSDLYLRLRELMASKRRKDEEGQGMVEYALILVLIAIVVIVILQVVGHQVNNVFSNISNGLSS
jgi:pilus assembly protein Flp/PilA